MSNETIIPSNPADIEKLKNGIEEIVNSMARAESEKEYQKESIDELSEKYQIEKKLIRQMASDLFKDTFDKKSNEFEVYTTLYETIVLS